MKSQYYRLDTHQRHNYFTDRCGIHFPLRLECPHLHVFPFGKRHRSEIVSPTGTVFALVVRYPALECKCPERQENQTQLKQEA